MKLQSNSTINLLDTLTSSEIKNLTLEIKETIAPDFVAKRKRNFTAVDLWHIHSMKRNVIYRRFAR